MSLENYMEAVFKINYSNKQAIGWLAEFYKPSDKENKKFIVTAAHLFKSNDLMPALSGKHEVSIKRDEEFDKKQVKGLLYYYEYFPEKGIDFAIIEIKEEFKDLLKKISPMPVSNIKPKAGDNLKLIGVSVKEHFLALNSLDVSINEQKEYPSDTNILAVNLVKPPASNDHLTGYSGCPVWFDSGAGGKGGVVGIFVSDNLSTGNLYVFL